MRTLYRMAECLPSRCGLLAAVLCLPLLVSSCGDESAQRPAARAQAVPPVYLEALQNAEAARYSLEQHNLQEQRIDALLGRVAPQPAAR